ncbi:MAG: hypothetical protein GX474_00395 [Bacteroidales bacterium]|nr:hypothetical protein [Bacteroidales bacterium]
MCLLAYGLLAGTAPDGRSLTPQDKGSLGFKKKLPDLVVSVTATGSKSTDRRGLPRLSPPNG